MACGYARTEVSGHTPCSGCTCPGFLPDKFHLEQLDDRQQQRQNFWALPGARPPSWHEHTVTLLPAAPRSMLTGALSDPHRSLSSGAKMAVCHAAGESDSMFCC